MKILRCGGTPSTLRSEKTEGSRRQENFAAKGLKEPKEVLVAAFVRTRPPQGTCRRKKDLTTEDTEV